MSKELGKKIAIKFTQPIITNVDGNESAFKVSGKEYNYEPGGSLVDAEYQIESISGYSAYDVGVDLENGIVDGLTYKNGMILKRDLYGKVITSIGGAKVAADYSRFGNSCAYFDGIDDYLSIPDSDDFSFGTGDFTLDFWLRFSVFTSGRTHAIYSHYQDKDNWFAITFYGTTMYIEAKSAGSNVFVYSFAASSYLSTSSWTHVAVVRSGTSLYVYTNGTRRTITTNTPISDKSVPDISGSVTIGYNATFGRYLYGYLDEFRVSKGVARWTASTFAVPSMAYNRDEYTKLLLHMDGEDQSVVFIDDSEFAYKTAGMATYGPYALTGVHEYDRSEIVCKAELPMNSSISVSTGITEDINPPGDYSEAVEISPTIISGGTATADSVYGIDYVDLAFDNDERTFWRSETNTSDHWIMYDLGVGNEQVVRRLYVLGSSNEYMGTFDSYIFQGSLDGVAWIDLKSGGVTDSTTSPLHVDIPNETAYRYYKFYISGTLANDNRASIREVKLFNTRMDDSFRTNIAGLVEGDDLRAKFLWVRVDFNTVDTQVTPLLSNVLLKIKDKSDSRVVQITVNPLSRFNNVAGNLTVAYDAKKGNLAGEGGPVASFVVEFTPDGLLKKPNPNDEENIEITDISANGNLIKIYYTDAKVADERIEIANISASGILTHINDL